MNRKKRSKGLRAPLIVFDPKKIQHARVMAEVPETELCKLAGGLGQTIHRLEEGGDQRTLSVGFLADVARVLGMRLSELLVDGPPPTPELECCAACSDDPAGSLADDVRTVGALLSAVGEWIAVDVVAMSLGWRLSRVQLALVSLDAALEVSGQRLAVKHDIEVRICSVGSAGPAQRSAQRARLESDGLHTGEAKLLTKLLAGVRIPAGRLKGISGAARLVACDVLELDDVTTAGGAGLALTDDSKFNLCVDVCGT